MDTMNHPRAVARSLAHARRIVYLSLEFAKATDLELK